MTHCSISTFSMRMRARLGRANQVTSDSSMFRRRCHSGLIQGHFQSGPSNSRRSMATRMRKRKQPRGTLIRLSLMKVSFSPLLCQTSAEHYASAGEDFKNRTAVVGAKEPKSINFFKKFAELQLLMLQHNAGLTASHPYASNPINWPFLLAGISFWTENKDQKQIYMVGNIVGWWICVKHEITRK